VQEVLPKWQCQKTIAHVVSDVGLPWPGTQHLSKFSILMYWRAAIEGIIKHSSKTPAVHSDQTVEVKGSF
jgi:hypothetical protein